MKLVNMANKRVEIEIPVKYMLDYKQCTSLGYKDVVAFMAPKTVAEHTDIVDKFVDENFIKKDREIYTRLDLCLRDELVSYLAWAKYLDQHQDVVGPDGNCYDLRQLLVYDSPTNVGDCGALVSCVDSTVMGGKILGMHVAGDDIGNGFSVILTKQMIEDVVNEFPKQMKLRAQADLQYSPYDKPPFEGNFVAGYGHELTVRAPTQSKIQRTGLYAAWGPSQFRPAHLAPFEKDGELIEPKKMAIQKYGGLVKYINQDFVDTAANHWFKKFMSLTRGKTRKVFDFRTAVEGDPGVKFCDGIPRQTSAGFPLQTMNKSRGKKIWFGEG